jgi:hypothetical protein
LDDAAADPHDTLRRAALESAAEHICSAENCCVPSPTFSTPASYKRR